MIKEKSKRIPLIDKEDRWIIRNLARYGNTLIPKDIVDFYQKQFKDEWRDEITRIFCNMTHHEAEPERFSYWETIIGNKPTWFVEYNGKLAEIR